MNVFAGSNQAHSLIKLWWISMLLITTAILIYEANAHTNLVKVQVLVWFI